MKDETNESESEAGPIVHRGDGTIHHLTVVDIDRSNEGLWVLRDILLWRGGLGRCDL